MKLKSIETSSGSNKQLEIFKSIQLESIFFIPTEKNFCFWHTAEDCNCDTVRVEGESSRGHPKMVYKKCVNYTAPFADDDDCFMYDRNYYCQTD